MMLKNGTGSVKESVGLPASFAIYVYNGRLEDAAPARASAMDTPKMAFAPSFDFSHPFADLVPSSSCGVR